MPPPFVCQSEIAKHPWVLNVIFMLPFLDLLSDYVQLLTAENWDTLFLVGAIVFALSQLWRIYVDSLAVGGWLLGGMGVLLYRMVKLLLAPFDLFLGVGSMQAEEGRCCSTEFEILDDQHLFENEEVFFKQLPVLGKYSHAFLSIAAGTRWYTNAFDNGMPEGRVPKVYYWRGALLEETLENVGGFFMSISVLLREGQDAGALDSPSVQKIIAVVSLVLTVCSAVYETGYLRRKVRMHSSGHSSGGAAFEHGGWKIAANVATLTVLVAAATFSLYSLYEPVSPAPTAEPTASLEPSVSNLPSLSTQPTLSGEPSLSLEPSVSMFPSVSPTEPPTFAPTPPPTFAPTPSPTFAPTFVPTPSPTDAPTMAPTFAPTVTTWFRLGSDVDGATADENSGWAVALSSDGSTLAIGAPSHNGGQGQVRVFQLDTTTNPQWNQRGLALGGGEAAAAGDQFGVALALSATGLILAVGAPGNDGNGRNAGVVRVFEFSNGAGTTGRWDQQGQDLQGTAAGDWFGHALDLSADGLVVAVGAWGNDRSGRNAGQVHVFISRNSRWLQRGQVLNGEAAEDQFGIAVALALDGAVVAAGSWANSRNGVTSGHVRVFAYQRSSSRWTQLGHDIDGEATGDESGRAVALSADGRTVAIGAYLNDGTNGSDSGHVRVWVLSEGSSSWNQLGQDLEGEASFDEFGYSVALSANGRTVAVGAGYNDGNGSESGQVRIFDFNPSTSRWQQVGEDLDGEAREDQFGGDFGYQGVALSADGRIMAAGAPYNDGNGSNAGHVRVFARL